MEKKTLTEAQIENIKMRSTIELKPCPFCGEMPKIENTKVEETVDCRPRSYRSVGIWCRKCWFGLCANVVNEDDIDTVLEEKIKHWNTRSQ